MSFDDSQINYRQQNLLKRQINVSLIYYLLTECENYTIIHENKQLSEKHLFFIQGFIFY